MNTHYTLKFRDDKRRCIIAMFYFIMVVDQCKRSSVNFILYPLLDMQGQSCCKYNANNVEVTSLSLVFNLMCKFN